MYKEGCGKRGMSPAASKHSDRRLRPSHSQKQTESSDFESAMDL